MQAIWVYNTICRQLTSELTLSLFIYSDVLNQIDKWKQIYNFTRTNYIFVSTYQFDLTSQALASLYVIRQCFASSIEK